VSVSSTLSPHAPTGGAAPVHAPFSLRLGIGLKGVLIAALVSGINNRTGDIGLADILGGYGLGRDEGIWLSSSYAAAEVSAMLLAPWLANTFSMRRFATGATLLFGLISVLCPFAPNFEILLLLRVLQGLVGGCLPPMLMTAALRFLPAHYRLFGLSAYALTSTFGPNITMPLVAFWTESADWRLLFWQFMPLCLLSAALIWHGIPQDPVHLDRIRKFNWKGALLGVTGLSCTTLALAHGERLGWFASPLICILSACGVVSLVTFLVHEFHHPTPLFEFRLLRRRNFAYGIVTLMLFVCATFAGSALPTAYLTRIHGYRPVQTMDLALLIAVPQIVLSPLVAFIVNRRTVDCRYVIATGLALMTVACLAGAYLTPDWIREQFFVLQLMHAVAQPMVVVPLLMMATGVVAPAEGPFASAMVNSLRALASTVAAAAFSNFVTWREHFHANVLLDHALTTAYASPLQIPARVLAEKVRQQAFVLAYADTFLALIFVIALMALVLWFVPVRAFPPQSPVRS